MDKELNEKYNKYVEAKTPKTKNFPTLINAFWVGGLICMIGQAISDSLMAIFPTMTLEEANVWMLVGLVFLASFLTGVGIFDKIGAFAGAGTIVPITGFSNSITSPAIEYKHEGLIFGVCVKMFTVAGPVIVNGVLVSFLIGIIYLFIV